MRAGPPDFQLEPAHIAEVIRGQGPKLVCLCNPNNPTGLHLADEDIREIAAACGEGVLILDEAYRGFVSESPFGPPPARNVIGLRSMTKDFALAGLRLGYALGEPGLLQVMHALQPPWSVSGAAQAAGLAALSDLEHLQRTLRLTREASRALRAGLSELEARVVDSPAHFLLIEVGNATEWRRRLMARGCLVRDCTSFGLPAYVRVGARTPEENRKFIKAWRDV
jgi:histidinol-phosphate/aromatic aminotransferase/cobyric acid decarboxylase-like protein